MPEQTAPPQAPAAPVAKPVTSATDYINRTDDELAAALSLPQRVVEAGRRGAVDPTQEAEPPPEPPEAASAASEVVDELPAVAAVAEATAEPAKPAEPEVKPEVKPLTSFVVKDAEGDLDPPLDLRFSFKANDKQYEDVPLDKVVKMAQMGYYNDEREQQVLASKQFYAEAEQRLAAADQRLTEIDAHVDRLLTDEAFRQRAIEIYQQQNSPEQRAVRAEQRVTEMQRQQQQQALAQSVQAFVATELAPRFDRLQKQYAAVTPEEIVGQYAILSAPLLRNGIVPPERWNETVRLIDHDLAHWVEARHEDRSTQTKAREQEAAKATTEVAKAKRLVARRTAPPAASAPAQQKRKPFATATDWMNSVLPSQTDD